MLKERMKLQCTKMKRFRILSLVWDLELRLLLNPYFLSFSFFITSKKLVRFQKTNFPAVLGGRFQEGRPPLS